MNTPHSERHILDRVRAGELTTADLKVADWQGKHPEQTIPAWFLALDRDLRADLIKVGWVAEVKTAFPLSEKAIFAMLCGYATTIQALRDEVAQLRVDADYALEQLRAITGLDEMATEEAMRIHFARKALERALEDGDA